LANQPIPTAIASATVPPPITSGQLTAGGGGRRTGFGAEAKEADITTGGGTGKGGGSELAGAASNPAAAAVSHSVNPSRHTSVVGPIAPWRTSCASCSPASGPCGVPCCS
jgi:hypothetical protein